MAAHSLLSFIILYLFYLLTNHFDNALGSNFYNKVLVIKSMKSLSSSYSSYLAMEGSLKQNIIAKNKKSTESDFRVHFTLMNVRWKNREHEKLIQEVFNALSKVCRAHIAQISSIIQDDIFDVSVGLYNDVQAFYFLKSKPIIKLFDGAKQNYYQPIVSRVFQSFINRMQKIETNDKSESQSERSAGIKTKQQKNASYYNKSLRQQRQLRQVRMKQRETQKMEETKKSMDIEESQLNRLKTKVSTKQEQIVRAWAFGIPKEFQIPEIKQSLCKYDLAAGECRWKNKEYMEFLQIDLSRPVTKQIINQIAPEIDGYPFVILPEIQENQITKQLAKYTVQIIIKGYMDDQQKIIRLMDEIGGVNIMLRTPIKQKDDFRYLIVFNNVSLAEKACREVKNFRQCFAERQQYELKVGRVNKFYTFTALMRQSQMKI